MNILVLNGSPKGDLSVTLSYIRYIQKKFPEHRFTFFHISFLIKKIESDEGFFNEIVEAVKSSDGIIWAFPVYYMLVPSQYKRFIELIWEKNAAYSFKDKYAVSFSTSVHFFDHTAHTYISSICDDLQMRYAGSFSAEMYDLLQEHLREKVVMFAQDFFGAIERQEVFPFSHQPLVSKDWSYIPSQKAGEKIDLKEKKSVIVIDRLDSSGNLINMVEYFRRLFKQDVRVVDLSSLDIKGGCLGCCHCGYDYTCVYRDDFRRFHDSFIRDADILIFAGKIHDRYASWLWKLFFDRSFFKTHTPFLGGKQVAYIIEGPLAGVPNLREILDAYVQGQGANLAGFVTDESADSSTVDALLEALAKRLFISAQSSYIKPMTFLGVGGRKVLRDCMWGYLQFPFLADHHFYSRHGLYDFPRRSFKDWLRDAMMMLLTRIPSLRQKIYGEMMKKEMIKPFERILSSEKICASQEEGSIK